MNGPRIILGLRLAVSAVFGILCLLLIALWWRSYEQGDWIERRDKNKPHTVIGSNSGTLIYGWLDDRARRKANHGWTHTAIPAGPTYAPDQEQWVRWFYRQGSFWIGISHWLAVSTVAALVAAPWIPPRFSLRTLLIATTLVAVGLGLVVYSAGK
jgi:hypothetical protein